MKNQPSAISADKPEGHRPTLRTLDILTRLSTAERGLSLSELTAATGIPKQTILPILKTLAHKKFINKAPGSLRYFLGLGPLVLASCFTESNAQLRLIAGEMKTLASTCNATCQLGILDGPFVVYLAKQEMPHSIPLVSGVGKRIYASCTALGKALLSEREKKDILTLYPDGLPQYTAASIQNFDVFIQELCNIRENIFAYDNGECDINTRCIAIPLRGHGKIVAAVSVSVHNSELPIKKKKLIMSSLEQAKRNIELILDSNTDFMLIAPPSV